MIKFLLLPFVDMNINYRPDIDGLRAISVLLVLFFHAGIFGVKAGFIGVDIFFVISGFLITTGIKNNLEKETFSFTEFFNRRLWRLQPVFIALLLVTLLMTTLTYLPEDYLNFTRSAKYAAHFRANNYFARLSTGYFADDVSSIPLLHTWSLSIEWQWYLILPFVMFLFYRLLKIKNFGCWLFPLTLIMIFIPFYFLEDRNSPHYYYSFLSRLFEMLIGSCLAVVSNKGVNRIPSSIKVFISILALAIIGYAGFSEGIIVNYPNWWAVAVCLSGATLIYLGGSDKKNLISRCLSFKPLVFIGVLSYSLYIWHWPVFAFIRNLDIRETWMITLGALLISLFLAFLSYRFVESRFRRNYSIPFWKSLIILVVIPLGLILMLDKVNQKHSGIPMRFGENYSRMVLIENEYNYKSRLNNLEICTHGAEHCEYPLGDKNILLIGDSFGDHSWEFIKTFAQDKNISLTSSTYMNCLMLPGIDQPRFDENDECKRITKNNYINIEKNKYDYVVISQVWTRYVSGNWWYSLANIGSDRSHSEQEDRAFLLNLIDGGLKEITESGAVPIIALNNYDTNHVNRYKKINFDVKKCVLKNYIFRSLEKNSCDFEDNEDPDREFIEKALYALQSKYKSLIILNMHGIQCSNKICLASIDGHPVYRDKDGHITDYASYQFGKMYLEKYGNPFKE